MDTKTLDCGRKTVLKAQCENGVRVVATNLMGECYWISTFIPFSLIPSWCEPWEDSDDRAGLLEQVPERFARAEYYSGPGRSFWRAPIIFRRAGCWEVYQSGGLDI